MATHRHRLAAMVGVAVLLGTVLGGGVAAAQTGYPPTTTTPVLCTHGDADAGTVSIGTTVTFTLCGPFQPGASVNLAVNGEPAGTKTANANGSVTVVITVTSATTAVVNDPVNVEITCGANHAVATGPGPTGASAASTGAFRVNCAPATTSGLAFTGTNIFKFVAGALLLIAIGAALVLTQRRRRSHAS